VSARRGPSAALALASLVALGLPAPAHADCADPLRNDDIVTLTLRMTPADWDLLRLGAPIGEQGGELGVDCAAQYPFVTAELRCGDDAPVTVGVRRKRGDQRGRDTDEKPPLKLDINRVVRGQRWPAALGERGYRKLTLNNGQADRPGGMLTALATEQLAWHLLFREVGTASRAALVRLLIELAEPGAEPAAGEVHGVYLLIEDIDRTALRARFGEDGAQGRLTKTTATACADEVEFDDGGRNEATAAYEAWAGLAPAAPRAGAWRARTERALDLDDLLRQEALRDVLGNREDTVLGGGNNHFAFDPVAGRRVYLPWDVDDALDPLQPAEGLSPACSFLGERTRCDPDIEPRYLAIVCQLLQGTLAPDALLAEWDAIDARLAPLLREERHEIWGGRDPLVATPHTYADVRDRVRVFVPARAAAVRAELEARGLFCPEGCRADDVEPCARLSCPGVRACVDGRMTPCEPFAEEVCNGADDDCDLAVDEGVCAPRPSTVAPSAPTADAAGSAAPAAPAQPATGCGGSPAPPAWALVALAFAVLSRAARPTRRGPA
jgi:hypothetical protein